MDTFRDMLFMDTLRGWDSTGVLGVSKDNNIEIHKDVGTAGKFIHSQEYRDFHLDAVRKGQIVVGHNRAATKGSVSDVNAHPFWVNNNTILVQNGTYKGEHKHHANVDVDTHAIAHTIDKYQDDVVEALRRINAAYTLVWYNVNKKQLNIVRNNERPMFLAETTQGGIVFASEEEFILAACSRNGVQLDNAPFELPAHRLVTVTLDDVDVWVYEETDLVSAEYDHKLGPYYQQPVQKQNPMVPFRQAPVVSAAKDLNEAKESGVPFGAAPTGGSTVEIDSDPAWLTEVKTVTQNRTRDTVKPEFTQYNFFNFINDGRFDADYGVAKDIGQKICDGFNTARTTKHCVELQDYIPANDHPNCVSWYVWGTLVTAENTLNSYVVFTKLIVNVPEAEVMKMVTEQCFYLTSGNTIVQSIGKNRNKVIVTASMQLMFEPVNAVKPIIDDKKIH